MNAEKDQRSQYKATEPIEAGVPIVDVGEGKIRPVATAATVCGDDPRVDTVAATWARLDGLDYDEFIDSGVLPDDNGYYYGALDLLEAADNADREAGIHRVRVDDATVERVACALMNSQLERHGIGPQTVRLPSHGARVDARAVLAELTGRTFSALRWRNRTP